jgi:hypothetical protein
VYSEVPDPKRGAEDGKVALYVQHLTAYSYSLTESNGYPGSWMSLYHSAQIRLG